MQSTICRPPTRSSSALRLPRFTIALAALVALPACGAGEGGDIAGDEDVAEVEQAFGLCASLPLVRERATASSVENNQAAFNATAAIDGDPNTRWSSAFSDPQWLDVDLGAVRHINRVSIKWEYAASRAYTIQVSQDGLTWTAVHTEMAGTAGAQTTNITGLDARGRFVRVHSTQRATPYGNSIFELEVFGDQNSACSSLSGARYRIDSVHSGKSIDVSGVSSVDGAAIHQWSYVGGANQQWIPIHKGQNQYQLQAAHSGKCLDIAGGSAANGAKAVQWPCHDGNNQRFKIENVGNGQYQLVAVHSGKCLDVAELRTDNGAPIQQWDCAGSNNQKWKLSAVGSGGRKWAIPSAATGAEWNWSTTVSSGGSALKASDPWKDILTSGSEFLFSFTHQGSGYAAGNITSGYSPSGVEPQSQAERDAGKVIDRNGRLSFTYQGPTIWNYNESFPVRLKLIDAGNVDSKSVRFVDYRHHCTRGYMCDIDVPLSELARPGFDFGAVKSVTFFVDSSVPGSSSPEYPALYEFRVGRMVFRTTSDPIDTQADPDNCGAVGRSCFGGACREGRCDAAEVAKFNCSQNMAFAGSHFYADDRSADYSTTDIYRYDLDGRNRTKVVPNVSTAMNLVWADGRLFWHSWAESGWTIRQAIPGQAPSVLYYGGGTQLSVAGANLITLDVGLNSYFSVNRATGSATEVTPGALSNTQQRPSSSGATSSHLYYLLYDNQGNRGLYQASLTNPAQAPIRVNAMTEYVSNLYIYNNAVYWSYTSGSTSGVRTLSSAPGATVQDAVAAVASPSYIRNAYVDGSGVYYEIWNGEAAKFVRTPLGAPGAVATVVTTGTHPYQEGGVTFSSDSVFWHEPCYKYGGGSVHRLRKP